MRKDTLLLDRLEENVGKDPSKIAFSFLVNSVDGGQISKSCTYQELQYQTTFLAQRLLFDAGLKRGDRALLVYPPSIDFTIAFLACLKAGVIAVPVFPPNPARRDTLHMFTKITQSSGAKVALTNGEYNYLKKLAAAKEAITRLKRPLGATWPTLAWILTDNNTNKITMNRNSYTRSTAKLPPLPNESDLAFLQYTSGSTSEPKGVMITHGNLAHNLTIITQELEATDDTVVVSWLPQYHDMGLIGSYLGALYCRGSGYYMSPLSFLQRPMLWMEAVSKYGGTHLQAPNFAFKLTARKFRASNYVNKPLHLQSVRHIINAAEPVDAESMDAFYNAFQPFGLPTVIFPTYGLAEHTVFVCSGGKQRIKVQKKKLEVDGIVAVVANTSDEASNPTPKNVDRDDSPLTSLVGCGFPNNQKVDVQIVDHESHHSLPANRVGEIWVQSASKAAGYFNREKETNEEFNAKLIKEDNGNNDKGYLRTGDLGFFHNNELFICGRLKDLIIVAGRNYYPQDIESTAEATSDKLRQGCSAAFSIDIANEGGEEVALIMELKEVPGNNAGIQTLCDPLADQIKAAINQEHSLSISYILFLKTKTVPKTSSGKIARAWCRKGYLAGTLQVAYRKSYKKDGTTFEIDKHTTGRETQSASKNIASLSRENITQLRALSKIDLMDKLRMDVAEITQFPPDSIDNDTALVTILDSIATAQFKGQLESVYAVRISDEYLFGNTVTLTKLAEVVKLGYAPDDTGGDKTGNSSSNNNYNNNTIEPSSSASSPPPISQGGTADGLAGMLGCPPGVRVCCVIQ